MSDELQAGDVFATHYRLEELIGEGGFARVFRASSPHGPVAVKLLRPSAPDEAAAREERFRREAAILAGLRSPHTVRLFDSGMTDEQPYLVSELLAGDDVADIIARGPCSESIVATVLFGVLHALDEAHAHGLVHRDVTPTNVRLVPTPHGPVAKLFDFGVARVEDAEQTRLTQTGAMVGTPRYMAQEQLLGAPATPASDIYSLAVVAYEMLLGTDAPGLDDPTSRLFIDETAPVSEPLRAMLNAMLEPSAARRPQRAAELLRQLQGPSPTEVAAAPESSTSNLAWIALLIIVVAVCAIAIARIVHRTTDNEPQPPPPVKMPVAMVPDVAVQPQDFGAAPDLAVPEEESPKPCEVEQPFVGWNRVETMSGLELRSYLTYAPALPPGTRAPLIVVLTDYREATSSLLDVDALDATRAGIDLHTTREFIEEIGLRQVADEHGVVIAVAHGPDHVKRVPLDFDLTAFDLVQKQLCIDPGRLFVAGMSLAGGRAMKVRCEDFVAGVATIRHRTFERCETSLKVPHIHFAFENDPLLPIGGGPTCNEEVVFPLADYELLWNQHLACGAAKMRPVKHHRDASCRSSSCDAAPFMSCVVPGHRSGLYPYVPSQCGKPAIDVDYEFGPAMWKFFSALEPVLEADAGADADGVPVEPDRD